MPRNFYITLNDKPLGTFGCREDAAYSIRYNAAGVLAREAVVHNPAHLFICFDHEGMQFDADVLGTYLRDALQSVPVHIKVTTPPVKSDWYTASVCITLDGTLAHVYHAFWWCTLLVRLILTDGYAESPALQIQRSSLDDANWYDTSGDTRRYTYDAFCEISTIDAAMMFIKGDGPVQHLG